jgi:hypothetical protein
VVDVLEFSNEGISFLFSPNTKIVLTAGQLALFAHMPRWKLYESLKPFADRVNECS